MNKAELVAAVAAESGLSKADAAKAVDGLIISITGALKKGKKISLVGFGTFESIRRKATTARNPRTGEKINVAAKNVAKFKAGKALNEDLN